MLEKWKDIPGYECLYQVSNMGNVKSLKFSKERILKPRINKGYLYVGLYINNTYKIFAIHQLVAITFLGHIPNGMETVINHIDNNQLNNCLDNIELVSNRYNSSCHKIDVGVHWAKDKNRWRSKITINNKGIHLGYYKDKEYALDMYQKALANQHLYDGDTKAFRQLIS